MKNCLPKHSGLDVKDACLRLVVKHKCGTFHEYSVSFHVDNELGLENQLNMDLKQLIALMQARAYDGVLETNGRKYVANEVNESAIKIGHMSHDVIVLPEPPKPVEPKKEDKKPEPKVEQPKKEEKPSPKVEDKKPAQKAESKKEDKK